MVLLLLVDIMVWVTIMQKKNENYTEKQVREVSLAHTNGEIINVKKRIRIRR